MISPSKKESSQKSWGSAWRVRGMKLLREKIKEPIIFV